MRAQVCVWLAVVCLQQCLLVEMFGVTVWSWAEVRERGCGQTPGVIYHLLGLGL